MILRQFFENREVTESKEVLTKIFMDKLRDEHQLQMKLIKLEILNYEQSQKVQRIERTQISDNMMIKYGFYVPDLQIAVRQHNIEEDEEVKNLKAEL